jgi:hypothetical protein
MLLLLLLLVLLLQEEAAIQAGWCAHLHAKYFSTVTGSLAPLRLSDGLAHSLWAISLVRSRTFSGERDLTHSYRRLSLINLFTHSLAHSATVGGSWYCSRGRHIS